MWSDTLLLAERQHLMRLALWGAMSVLTGTVLLALVAARRLDSPLLRHFAIQGGAWGAVELAVAVLGLRTLALRDWAGAMRLVHQLWLKTGLDVAIVAVGATLAIMGWSLAARRVTARDGTAGDPGSASPLGLDDIPPRRLGAVGAGVAVALHGAAMGVLDVYLLSQIVV
jgi:hypothetical protein